MQQIGPYPRPAQAAIADPTHFPIAVRRPGARALGRAQRKWVLHRALLLRLGAAFLVALLLASAFHARGGILSAIDRVRDIASSGLATAGLGISAIDISGQAITSEKAVTMALGIGPDTSLFGFDVAAARERLLQLPAVAEAHIAKIYPNRLAVTIVEHEPVARWRLNGQTYLIDKAGDKLGPAISADDDLPLVIGVGAGDDAQVLLAALKRFPVLEKGLAAVSRIADRRWDLLYRTGLRVQLPAAGMGQALKALNGYERNDKLLERDLTLIDMRVPGLIAVKLAKRDEKSN